MLIGLGDVCTVYKYGSDENINPSELLPGDIVVKRAPNNLSGHMHIIASIDAKGNTYVYDAGGEQNWLSHYGKEYIYNMWKDSHSAMTVIRFNGISSETEE